MARNRKGWTKVENVYGFEIKAEHCLRKWQVEQDLLKLASDYLKIRPFEVVIENLEIKPGKSKIRFRTDIKKRYEIGAEVRVEFQDKEITDKISYIDFDFQFIKIHETKQVPYAFDRLIFVETVKIEKDEKV